MDKNGKLSLEEMMNGCDKSDAMAKLMHLLDLRREDLATVFRVVDDENKGEVSYLQLCQLLASFLDRDPVIVQSLIKYSVADLRKLVQHEVRFGEHSQSVSHLGGTWELYINFTQPQGTLGGALFF